MCSCSVKEDRSACPCRFSLDFSGLDQGVLVSSGCVSVCWTAYALGGGWSGAGSFPSDAIPSNVELTVPKDSLELTVASVDLTADNVGITVPEGRDFPRLYLYHGIGDATGDDGGAVVLLHKEHSVMHLYVRNVVQDGASYSVSSGTIGCDRAGNPIQGAFSCILRPDSKGYASVVIPRQGDLSLKLNVHHAGELVRSIAIGEYVVESGFDWTALDLEDIRVEIDFMLSMARVRINQWQKTLSFTIVV